MCMSVPMQQGFQRSDCDQDTHGQAIFRFMYIINPSTLQNDAVLFASDNLWPAVQGPQPKKGFS